LPSSLLFSRRAFDSKGCSIPGVLSIQPLVHRFFELASGSRRVRFKRFKRFKERFEKENREEFELSLNICGV